MFVFQVAKVLILHIFLIEGRSNCKSFVFFVLLNVDTVQSGWYNKDIREVTRQVF